MKTVTIRYNADDSEFKIPETYLECTELSCNECATFIEGTKGSRYFASNFDPDTCYTRSNFKKPSLDDQYWDKYSCL